MNGPTLRTRNELVSTGCNVVCFAKGIKSWRHRDAYPTSLLLQTISLACEFAATMIWSLIQVKTGCTRSKEQRFWVWIPWTSLSVHRQLRLRDVDRFPPFHIPGILLRSSVYTTRQQHTRALDPIKHSSSSILYLLLHLLPRSIHMQSRSSLVAAGDQVHGGLWIRLLRHQRRKWATSACPRLESRLMRQHRSSSQLDSLSALLPVDRNSLSLSHLLRVPSLLRLSSHRQHVLNKVERRDNGVVRIPLCRTMEATTAVKKIWHHSDSRHWTYRLTASSTLHPARRAH